MRIFFSLEKKNDKHFYFLFPFFSLRINALLAHYGYDSIAFNQLEEETWYNQEKFRSWIDDVRRATNPLHTATLTTKETPVMRTVLLGLDGRRRRRNIFDALSSITTTPLSVSVPSSASTSTITSPSPFPSLSALIPYYHMMFPQLASYPTTSSTIPPNPTCGPSSTYTCSLPIPAIPSDSSPSASSGHRSRRHSPLDPHRPYSSPLSQIRSRSPSRESQTESDLVSLIVFFKKKILPSLIILLNYLN